MAAQAKATSPGDGGGSGTLKWFADPNKKDQWLAYDGEKRPPARIQMSTQGWLGKEPTHYVYRNSEYLGSRSTLEEAKLLAKSGQRTEQSLRETFDGTADGMPAFMILTDAERDASRERYWEQRYGSGYTLIPLKKREDYMAKYEGMSVDVLASEYNQLVDTARSMGLDAYRPVTRFKDKADALKYIEAVESGIRARQVSEKAAKQEGRSKTGPTPKEISPPPKSSAKTAASPPPKDTEEMATSAKKASKKAAKKVAKKGAKKAAKTAVGPKVYERPAGKKGEFTTKLGTKPGTNQDTLALFLFDNLGKSLPREKVTKSVYGSADASGLNNVLGALRNKLAAAKMPYNIKIEGNEIGLYNGSAK